MDVSYEVREAPCTHCGSGLFVVVRIAGNSVVEMGKRVADEADAEKYMAKLVAADERVRVRRAEAQTVLERQSARAVKLAYIPPDGPV